MTRQGVVGDDTPGVDVIDLLDTEVDGFFSFADTTILVMNGADHDLLTVKGAGSFDDITFA